MAKADFPTWMKFTIAVLVILGIGVGWGVGYKALAVSVGTNTLGVATNARNHTEHVIENDEHEKAMLERVHNMELKSKDIEAIAVQGVEALTSINSILTDIREKQAEQALIQAVNSEKLKTLTKD